VFPILKILKNYEVFREKFQIYFLVLSILLFLPYCATVYKPPPQEPFSYQKVATLLSKIHDQEKKVSSFYTYGSLLIKDWKWESESKMLIVATKNPFKTKIEITHPWGRPIVHILIDETRLKVLSFTDKKLYLGHFSPEALSKFFPGDFDSDLIWTALRGYPNLLRYHKAVSLKANQITLFDKKENEVEIIDFYPESLLPRLVSFSKHPINLAFSDFQENDGIFYAKEVKVDNIEGEKDLILKNDKMVFNKNIPEQIFVLEKPPTFKTFYLQESPDAERDQKEIGE
jgi:hypothetical protein